MFGIQILTVSFINLGVELLRYGKLIQVGCKKEVILSAGSIGSPQILMLSGVGPKKHLQELKVNFFFAYSSIFAMRGSPTYIINVLIFTLLPGSDGLSLHLPGSPQPNSR